MCVELWGRLINATHPADSFVDKPVDTVGHASMHPDEEAATLPIEIERITSLENH